MEALAWVVGIGGALYLLFRFPGRSLVFVGLLAAVGAAVWLIAYAVDQAAQRKAAKVRVTVAHDSERCGHDYPLFVGILNQSGDTVERVAFGVEGHREGYSSPLYDSGFLGYTTDRIIPDGDGWASCWTLPRQAYGVSEDTIMQNPVDTLIWTAKNVRPTFRQR